MTRTCSETASIESPDPHPEGDAELHRRAGRRPRGGAGSGSSMHRTGRRVMASGKLARDDRDRILGPVGCSEFDGKPQCTRADIRRGLANYKRLGVRGMFVAHWVNNAFSGAALEGGTTGTFINILNRFQTRELLRPVGLPIRRRQSHDAQPRALGVLATFLRRNRCHANPNYLSCNPSQADAARALDQADDRQPHVIEVDHLSESARDEGLSSRPGLPVVSVTTAPAERGPPPSCDACTSSAASRL